MIKVEITKKKFVDWFLKSLRPEIYKDVTMMGARLEEEAILISKQLDLIYSQSSMI